MMVRKRVHNASDSSSVAANIRQERKHPKSDAYSWTRSKLFIAGIIILLMLGIAVYIHNTYRIYIENLVVTKSDLSLASQADAYDPFVWGTYRSHLYFGLRNRHPQSPLFGLLWYKQPREREIRSLPLRHWCDQGDNLKYMWHDADGKTFGHQTIEDGRLKFNTDWFNQHHSWSARIDVKSLPPNTSYAFVFYLAVQDQNTDLELVQKINKGHYVLLQGFSPLFDDFELSLQTNRAFPAISYTTHKANQLLDMTQVNNLILSSLGRQDNGDLVLVPRDESASSPNFVAVQLNINGATEPQSASAWVNGSDHPMRDPFRVVSARPIQRHLTRPWRWSGAELPATGNSGLVCPDRCGSTYIVGFTCRLG
ncbi:mannosyl-oligosaccharide glucosidase [Ditylenchus destructor]|uniref:Mannosyl-oligosaccharide glucosidase n=1 Tax=Ditylenchus destructor TaxID=166010 RepID=A0AAD4NJ64_9BILA|nr:mannosyl-oligosaccharide glucosidase [Ditylenchus destructor]